MDFVEAQDTEPQAQAPKVFRVMALGDSLTAGYRLPKLQAFPSLVEKSLREKGYRVDIVNSGVSGDTARQAYARLDWTLNRAGPFDAALVALGANDGLRRSPVPQMRENLERIVVKLKEQGVSVYLLGMKLPLNWEKGYREEFEAVYPDLAKKHSLPLYPFILEGLALSEEYNLEDRIHPNLEGHGLIATRLESWVLGIPSFKASLEEVKSE
jgi:acyl-CoA thioesterase I